MGNLNRIRWRCRRGLLELDLILAGFLERHLARLDANELQAFDELLDAPDNDLLDWALGRKDPSDSRYLPLLALLRAG